MDCEICGQKATHGIGNSLFSEHSFCDKHSEKDLQKDLEERLKAEVFNFTHQSPLINLNQDVIRYKDVLRICREMKLL